ncbi:MAG: site-specific integrase [Bacteroidaceae bacterium]|nr:site-specific integrase [Bacteroidaceae bacterium]
MNQIGNAFVRALKGVFHLTRDDSRPFFPMAKAEIEGRVGKVSESTVTNERTAYNLLHTYCHGQLRTCDITPGLISDFDQWNKARGISANARAAYLRSLRALINRMGCSSDLHLFDHVRTNKVKVAKRAIAEEDIRRISSLPPETDGRLSRVKALFLFCMLANGMSFIDVAFLRWEQIKNGFITYHRHKTGGKVIVPVTPKLDSIIRRWGVHDSPYVFGLLSTAHPLLAYRQYIACLRRYNKRLARIEALSGLDVHITSYTARHTWASLAVKRGQPLAAISKALGHTSVLTTELYLKEIGVEDLKRATYCVAEMIDI